MSTITQYRKRVYYEHHHHQGKESLPQRRNCNLVQQSLLFKPPKLCCQFLFWSSSGCIYVSFETLQTLFDIYARRNHFRNHYVVLYKHIFIDTCITAKRNKGHTYHVLVFQSRRRQENASKVLWISCATNPQITWTSINH